MRDRRFRRAHRDLIVLLYARLGSTRAVAERTGFSRGKVLRYLRREGVEMRPPGRPRTDRASDSGSSYAPPE